MLPRSKPKREEVAAAVDGDATGAVWMFVAVPVPVSVLVVLGAVVVGRTTTVLG